MFGLFKKREKPQVTGHFQAEAEKILAALGGVKNVTQVNACITRLRVGLEELSLVDYNALKLLGAADIVEVGSSVQAIFGSKSAEYAEELKKLLAK